MWYVVTLESYDVPVVRTRMFWACDPQSAAHIVNRMCFEYKELTGDAPTIRESRFPLGATVGSILASRPLDESPWFV